MVDSMIVWLHEHGCMVVCMRVCMWLFAVLESLLQNALNALVESAIAHIWLHRRNLQQGNIRGTDRTNCWQLFPHAPKTCCEAVQAV